MSTTKFYFQRNFIVNKLIYFRRISSQLLLQHSFLLSGHPFRKNSEVSSTAFNEIFPFFNMTTIHSSDIDCPIAPFLSISSARLRSLILKKHLTTLNAQLRTEKKADPHLTRMILLNMFQIFQITRVNFDQYLHIHKHPDTYSTQKDATTQTEHTTIKPKRLLRTLSNRMRSEMEKQRLNSYWPSDDNDDTDEDLQKDPPEALLDDNYPHKTYTYVSF